MGGKLTGGLADEIREGGGNLDGFKLNLDKLNAVKTVCNISRCVESISGISSATLLVEIMNQDGILRTSN